MVKFILTLKQECLMIQLYSYPIIIQMFIKFLEKNPRYVWGARINLISVADQNSDNFTQIESDPEN